MIKTSPARGPGLFHLLFYEYTCDWHGLSVVGLCYTKEQQHIQKGVLVKQEFTSKKTGRLQPRERPRKELIIESDGSWWIFFFVWLSEIEGPHCCTVQMVRNRKYT